LNSAAATPAAGSNGAFLQIHEVTKDFGPFRAVNNVSLDIAKGEIFALLGSSGCGKSTLLRMLAGFEMPTSGRIVLNGRDLAGLPPYERPMNMMFQSYALFPHLSVWDNIAFGLRREGMARDQDSSSGWHWRAAWPSSRRCCCSTSRWARSTRSCARRRRSSWSTSSRPWA
jgi:ABC-type sugar transport system ATPase subunit